MIKAMKKWEGSILLEYLTPNEVNQSMRDIKWLFREYKGLDVITIENKKRMTITKLIL